MRRKQLWRALPRRWLREGLNCGEQGAPGPPVRLIVSEQAAGHGSGVDIDSAAALLALMEEQEGPV